MILCHIKDIGREKLVFIETITTKEEKEIDDIVNNKGVWIKNDHKINSKNIFFYGEIDLNSDDDLDIIEKNNLVDENGNYIPTTFNYDNEEITTNENGCVKQYPTTDPILWFKYCHCIIGKPKRVVVYKTWK